MYVYHWNRPVLLKYEFPSVITTVFLSVKRVFFEFLTIYMFSSSFQKHFFARLHKHTPELRRRTSGSPVQTSISAKFYVTTAPKLVYFLSSGEGRAYLHCHFILLLGTPWRRSIDLPAACCPPVPPASPSVPHHLPSSVPPDFPFSTVPQV